MKFLDQVIRRTKQFKALDDAIRSGSRAAAIGVSGVHKANIVTSLCRERSVRAFCVAQNEQEAQVLCNDIGAMGLRALVYPKKDFIYIPSQIKSHEYEHQRLNVLSRMLSGDYDVVIATLDAAAQYTIPKEILCSVTRTLEPDVEIDLTEFEQTLILLGYERCDNVEGSGQFSIRGGIIDLFMPDSDAPVRIELWGDQIDTINYFDVETQRRTDYCEAIDLTPSGELLIGDKNELVDKIDKKAARLKNVKAKERLQKEADMLRSGIGFATYDKFISLVYDKPATLFDYFDDNEIVFISEYKNVKERDRSIEFHEKEELKALFEDGVLCRGFETYALDFTQSMDLLLERPTVFLDTFSHSSYNTPLSAAVTFNARQTSPWSGQSTALIEDLEDIGYGSMAVVILAGTAKGAENLCSLLNEKGVNALYVEKLDKAERGFVYVMPGMLSAGIEYPEQNFILYSLTAVSAAYKKKRRRTPKDGKAVYNLSELSPGEYVVHSIHGIGIYRGVRKMDVQGFLKDYIMIEYAKGDNLYVPVTQLDLVAKYIGPKENSHVKLNRLGSKEWVNSKRRVKAAAKEMAKELIELYSKRMQAKGHAFSGDNEWQHDFEAGFPYEETEDQLRCCDEIKHDMERAVPMDRLLCGDVGFGKTEVALRAAFKCVSDSMQCALLCPTTILAWQHYQTVLSRFDGYPIRIELLSRFRSPAQQKEILDKLKHGEIDMIIGTHRLVQKDVEFRNLGLAIIDEEQRFGVAQKEHFKELRKNIDILTLSATPIPRTLNMAMSGIRDMSVIEEAPLDRHPVQTYVLEHDPAIIHEAIRRELRRGGQVFYLFNNVEGIEAKAIRISEAIPEANVAVGHGKMSEQELSDVWRRMLNQEINVLVCTTIIETGVDLPNANTLIIENADRFGLSQLHQIRGRVGRSSRRAYAYFTYNGAKVLSDISQKRLTAIREFTEFGSGFKIAMRDLELRGAGNILGAEQHGHMEDVGYDMYIKLLGEAVREEKGEQPEDVEERDCLIDIQVQAHIPENYIESLSNRLDAYRRIADIRSPEDARDVIDELVDRYGDVPDSVMGLIDIALVRNRAAAMGIYEIRQNDTNLMLYLSDIRRREVPELIAQLPGRAMLSAGGKPYIAVRLQKGETPSKLLKKLFGA
ncbi:MAG: transcription-repair coupling factor [Ruminococcus sp.]|uniref:transcription-repair coupling factor n=1 Tax=Ruminococcus sp. TaxID=41978 RepID=UPI0028738C81|nr:transcription-repair coupling factor [Ruminococcus sp.]MBQ3284929.1 transcription-repair coupling factor [Ruminococcus sp.]